MNIKIETDQKLKIRNAAQLLNAITLMDDAISMTEASASDLVERLNDIHPHRSLGDELMQLGKELLEEDSDFDLDNIDPLLMNLVVQENVNTCAGRDDLELKEIGTGSIRGQFRKSINKYRQKLKKVFTGMTALLPSGDAIDFKTSVAPTMATSTLSESAKQTASGVMVVAAASARQTLDDINATGLEIDDSDTIGATMALA